MTTPEQPSDSDRMETEQPELTRLPEGSEPSADRTVIIPHPSPPKFEQPITRRKALALMGLAFVGGAGATSLIYESQKNSQPNPTGSPDPGPTFPPRQTESPGQSTQPIESPSPGPSPERIPGFLYPGDAIYRVENAQGRVSITIDDCNSEEVMASFLDMAAQYRANGFPVSFTFFPRGQSVEEFPDVFKRAIADGHELGTHTYSHPFLTDPKLKEKNVRNQIAKGLKAIHDNVDPNYRVRFFRAPFGDGAAAGSPIDPEIELVCKELGLVIAGWNKSSADTATGIYDIENEAKAAQRMMRNLGKIRQGNIILYHANSSNSVAGVRALIESLIKGGKFKADRTLSEMVKFADSIPTSGVIYQSTTL